MNTSIKVSAIMPTYNSARFLSEAIESVLEQSLTSWELIIVDDGSSDSTQSILANYSDDRIRVVTFPQNKGRGAARNACLTLCSGDYIAMCDSDDISLPERFRTQAAYLDSHPDIGVIASQVLDFGDRDAPYVELIYPMSDAQIKARFARGRMPIPNASAMFRSSLLERAPSFDVQCRFAQDLEFYLRLAPFTNFHVLEEPLVLYRSGAKSDDFQRWRQLSRYRRFAVHRASAKLSNSTLLDYEKFERRDKINPGIFITDLAIYWRNRLQIRNPQGKVLH